MLEPAGESEALYSSPLVEATVQEGTEVYTDEYYTYDTVSSMGLAHRSVNHAMGEYATPDGRGRERPRKLMVAAKAWYQRNAYLGIGQASGEIR